MVYQYTKPRGPIAAMYGSPGPCYNLPGLTGQTRHDPRSPHNKAPAYPFGIRHGKFKDDCSPGPAYNPDSKVYRDGMDGTPHYSLYSRQKEANQFKVPGPGAYSPEASGPSAAKQNPKYSFGKRHRHRRTDNTPAANSYTLAHMLGKCVMSSKRTAPIYSMTGRQPIGGFSQDYSNSPGPGTYDTTEPTITKNKGPLYSMTSRNRMPGDTTQKPGPGAHQPEKVNMNTKLYPSYSFGIRHSQYLAPLIVEPCD